MHTGIALVTGTEDRQWLYPAMTRGTDANLAYVFTTPARPADSQPGTRPALELDRYERIRRERAGYPTMPLFGARPHQVGEREPIAVLADVLNRDGAELSASVIRQRNLVNADHLATLHAIWAAETTAALYDRYRDLVTAALPPGHRKPLSHRARWLFRTLHASELVGLDPADVIRTAIITRDLAGSRDIAAVPDLPDPNRRAYLAKIAAMMDDRIQRLGQHTVQTTPAWAVATLGPVPADPAARRQWEYRASAIAAYREMYGHDHPRDPIGPEPSRETPDKRAAWYEALTALSPACGADVQTMPDGRLWLIRDTYAAETAWAPRHVGKKLRLSRLGTSDADLGAIRAGAEADAARKVGDHARAKRQETLAASYRALRDHYQQREHALAQAMADRQEWEHAPAQSRRLAIASDAELRRRHPDQKIEPLRSAEQGPASHSERLHPAPAGELTEVATRIRTLAAQHQAFRARMDERQRQVAHSEDLDWAGLGETLRSPWAPRRDAILQPPKSEITPSARILQLAVERDAEPEAADLPSP